MFPLLAEAMELSSIIKSIALDEKSAAIAKSLPNFSHFVRECLYRHAVRTNLECNREKSFRGTDRCNPFHQPVCWVCWPNGSPGSEAIKQFTQDKLNVAFLDHRAKIVNSELIELSGINRKVAKTHETPPPKASFWSKLLGKLK